VDLPADEPETQSASQAVPDQQKNSGTYVLPASVPPEYVSPAEEGLSSNRTSVSFPSVTSITQQPAAQIPGLVATNTTVPVRQEIKETPSVSAQSDIPQVASSARILSAAEQPVVPTGSSLMLPAVDDPAPSAKTGAEHGLVAERTLSVVDPAALRELLRIEVQYDARLQDIHLELLAPDFVRPADLKGQAQNRLWESVHNRYQHAIKINELAPRHGRIQNILKELEELIALAPTCAAIRRDYAYLRYGFAKKTDEVIKLYQEITYITPTVFDWYNLAVLALAQDSKGEEQCHQAYYALSQVFKQASLVRYLDAWYCYIGLLREVDDYIPLMAIYQAAVTRGFLPVEEQQLFTTCVYLLKCRQKEEDALDLVKRWQEGGNLQILLHEISTRYFTAREIHIHQRLQLQWEQHQYRFWEALKLPPVAVVEPSAPSRSTVVWSSSESGQVRQLHGSIGKFDANRGFGFVRGNDGQEYFFHRSAVVDEHLLEDLLHLPGTHPVTPIPVLFSATHGSKGLLALNVSRQRDIQQIFDLAVNYANDGEYEKANAQIKLVLAQNPNYPQARAFYDDWREFARAKGVPRGSNPYARAKRKQLIEKDLESAIPLFREAIRRNDSVESAIKDLAQLLTQLNRPREAIEVLQENRGRINDQQSMNNLLVDCYQKAEEYANAIVLLRKMLAQVPSVGVSRKAQICWRIGTCYLRMENYKEAEHWFREVIKLGSNSKAAQRNLALCLLRQGRDEEAEKLLQANLPDAQSAELLDAMIKARETGQSIDIMAFDTQVTLADFSSEISTFARFFIERCTYEGVDSQHRISRQFDRMDVRKLEELATRLGTRRPRERAEYYLSAAKIILENEEWEEEYTQLYKYLCRSFASRGDAAITENRPVDTAREWYCEALSVYDGDRGRSRDEQDATNAIVRFLLATISRTHVPFRAGGPENLRIDEGLEQILRLYSQPEKTLPAIAYLVFRSQFAANRILTRLYSEPDFQRQALIYLKSQGIGVPEGPVTHSQFSELWKRLQLKDHERTRDLAVELHTIASRIDLTTVAVEESLGRLRIVEQRLFFDQDRRQVDELQKILEAMLDLSQQTTFEEKERLCTQIEKRCQDMRDEIETSPTRLSVESIHPIVVTINTKNTEYLERTYESSVPQLTLRLPKDMASYSPDVNNHRFEVQVVIENKSGCSPADAIELIIPENEEFFTVEMPEIKLEGSLRGGDQRIKPVLIQVTELALQSQAFTLPIYAQYRTRSGDIAQTQEVAFAINLYSADHFERIENPYAAYASGHVVAEERMFYGRSELIRNIADAICNAQNQKSKGIVIFGQKRSGKSSILYHLKVYLQQKYENLLVVDLGSVGSYLDDASAVPLHYQLLGGILSELQHAIEDEIEERKRNPLEFSIPDSARFYAHPTPLLYFQEVLKGFKRTTGRADGWHDVHLVLLLDEFSYLHGLIARKRLSEDFMRNWKAILQEDLFSVVLAGQDVMPKFIASFPNEFAAIKDQRISYLEPDEARKLIDEPICMGGRSGKSRYREKAIDRILDLTAASPFYIQIFCDRLVEYMNRRRINLVTQTDVEQVKNELITGVNALVDGKFDNLISSGDTSPEAISEKDASAVLKVIAMNSRTGLCSRDRIIVETQTDVEDILRDLLAREVIEAKGQYYAIRVGLFKEWLITH
jgi:tetratricopeptide (TPR) repeat protein